MGINKYFVHKTIGGKEIRLFIIPTSFKIENRIDLKHSRLGEIKELKWVTGLEHSNCLPSMNMIKYLLDHELKTTPHVNSSEEDAYSMYQQMQINEEKRTETKKKLLGSENYYFKLRNFKQN